MSGDLIIFNDTVAEDLVVDLDESIRVDLPDTAAGDLVADLEAPLTVELERGLLGAPGPQGVQGRSALLGRIPRT